MNENSNQRNTTLDLLKGIACIGVVFIHVPFPGIFGIAVTAVSRMFVALFFIISGYYLWVGDEKKTLDKLPKKIKRTLKLTATSFLVYFLWESFVRLKGGGYQKVIRWYADDVFSIKTVIGTLFFSYDSIVGHLWFLLALLGGYILFYYMLKSHIRLNWISAILILEIHIILMSISHIYDLGWNMAFFRNVWFYGMPFLIIGYSIRLYEIKLLSYLTRVRLIAMFLLGLFMILCERFVIGKLQIFNGSIIAIFAMVMLALKYPDLSPKNGLAVIGNKYSTDIYIYHWIILEIVIKSKKILQIECIEFEWLEPVIVLGITLILAWGLKHFYLVSHIVRRKKSV